MSHTPLQAQAAKSHHRVLPSCLFFFNRKCSQLGLSTLACHVAIRSPYPGWIPVEDPHGGPPAP